VVISENNKLVALINPDVEAMKKDNITEEQFPAILESIRKEVNERLPEFMAVSKFRIHSEEFAKTPKRSIKRFLYTKK
jgi:long-chain acyl-CoA synthetase